MAPTITGDHQDRVTDYTAIVYGCSSMDSNAMKSPNPHSGFYEAETSRTLDNNGGTPNCNQGGMVVLEGNGQRPSHKGDGYAESEVSYTLNGTEQHGVCAPEEPGEGMTLGRDRASFNQGQNAQFDFSVEEEKIGAQTAKGPGAVCNSVVRRLTPLECTRLQGFPNGWVDIGEWTDEKGKVHKDADAPKYKALGNSIALPWWNWLIKRISAQYERTPTMGSLFDGIGGFPLCWERVNGVGTARWASEIEPFCVAVTKKHFGDEDAGIEGDIRKYL